jgi:hypothetical protein
MANVLQQSRKGRGYADFLEFPTGEVLRTRVNGPLSCSKRRGFKKEVEHVVPANGAFIRPVSLWGAPTLQRWLQSLRMDRRASGGVHITRTHLINTRTAGKDASAESITP